MYDLLIVGSGISAATICATLKDKLRICVVDIRQHIGGNCYDYKASGSYIHQYGPHIFHSTSPEIVKFLSHYTEWNEAIYAPCAEIEHEEKLITVPFPYCKHTEEALGRKLSEEEVLKAFFHGYSKKMWDVDWDYLPKQVKGRVPKDTKETPDYFPGQFCGYPKLGYTRMLENMFDGVDVLLGVGPNDWRHIAAKKTVYCGRLDHLLIPNSHSTIGEMYGYMSFRSLRIRFQPEDFNATAPVVNFCHLQKPYTRKTSYARLTGGTSNVVSTETPYSAELDDPTPYYPIPSDENISRHEFLMAKVRHYYPDMFFVGRLSTYKYLDMFQAVGQAQGVAKKIMEAR